MGLFKKTKILIAVLLVLNLIAVGGYWFLSRGVSKNNEVVSDLARELDVQINKEQQLQNFKALLEETKSDRETLSSYFISSSDVVSFIQEVESLSTTAGVEVEIGSVAVEDLIENEFRNEVIEVLNISLTTTGSWAENFYFLKLIESLPHKISVNRFNLNVERDVNGEVVAWSGVLGLKVLKLK